MRATVHRTSRLSMPSRPASTCDRRLAETDCARFRRPANGPAAHDAHAARLWAGQWRSEEHTSELQSLMRISYAVFCLKKKKTNPITGVTRSQTQMYDHEPLSFYHKINTHKNLQGI